MRTLIDECKHENEDTDPMPRLVGPDLQDSAARKRKHIGAPCVTESTGVGDGGRHTQTATRVTALLRASQREYCATIPRNDAGTVAKAVRAL
jgi:hypothetical protein